MSILVYVTDDAQHVRSVRADLFVVVCVEGQAEQVRGVFGGAVGLGASLVLNVFKTKS